MESEDATVSPPREDLFQDPLLESPGTVLDKADPGDDVQLRFRYQHAYAAIQCLRILQDDGPVAVFCENHEDVVVENADGKFVGIQVKTRAPHRPAFTTSDPDFSGAVARFARIHRRFNGWFSGFAFVTNPRFADGSRPNSPPALLDSLRERGTTKGLRADNPIRSAVRLICSTHNIDEPNLVAALLRTNLVSHESNLENTYRDLVQALGSIEGFGSHSYQTLCRIADNLVYVIFQCSSKNVEDPSLLLYDPQADFETTREKLLLSGKRLSHSHIKDVIEGSLPSSADNLLVASGLVGAELPPPGTDVLREKLDAGGVEQERMTVIEDCIASLETAYLQWTHKYTVKTASARLQHLFVLICPRQR